MTLGTDESTDKEAHVGLLSSCKAIQMTHGTFLGLYSVEFQLVVKKPLQIVLPYTFSFIQMSIPLNVTAEQTSSF